jgi:hypothetical protein
MVAISANIDIGSTFSNINFSYPEVDIDGNTKNGYLDLFGNSTYLHFNYDSIKIDETNKQLCVIHKSPDDTKIAYIVFNYVKGTNYDKLYNKPYIHLNHHIANEIVEGSTLRYDSDGFHILGDSSTPSKILIYFKNTMLKLNTDNIPNTIKGTITMPTISTTPATKTFKRGMFINDEVDCGESTIGETIAKNKYATTVAGNLGISIGFGIIIIVGVIALITYNKNVLKFTNTQKLFNITDVANGLVGGNNINNLKAYNFGWAILFALSIICFIAYGGVMLDEKKSDRDSTVSGLLATAIITLILFIFMIGYKGLVLTPAA